MPQHSLETTEQEGLQPSTTENIAPDFQVLAECEQVAWGCGHMYADDRTRQVIVQACPIIHNFSYPRIPWILRLLLKKIEEH